MWLYALEEHWRLVEFLIWDAGCDIRRNHALVENMILEARTADIYSSTSKTSTRKRQMTVKVRFRYLYRLLYTENILVIKSCCLYGKKEYALIIILPQTRSCSRNAFEFSFHIQQPFTFITFSSSLSLPCLLCSSLLYIFSTSGLHPCTSFAPTSHFLLSQTISKVKNKCLSASTFRKMQFSSAPIDSLR